MRRPAFWIALVLAATAAIAIGVRYFPQAFSIVALDITMDRPHALAAARAIADRDHLGPGGYRQAASFSGDDEAQTFVELEGGGKDAFTRMLRDQIYAAYTWRVRHFTEGETREVTIAFTPDGQPYGFVEKLKEDAPGAALDAAAARRIAEDGARERWHADLDRYGLVEQGAERRPSGRVDHTFTYERSDVTFADGRVRLRLVVSGDRLTAVEHLLKIPEAFTRRYASMRSANELIGVGSAVSMVLLYVIGGIGVGLFFMMRRRWVLWRTAARWAVLVSGLQSLATINELPLAWMTYDTALSRSTFVAQQLALIAASFVGFAVFFALSFIAAETLSRRAFGGHPQLWRAWGREEGASLQILGRTVSGYLLVSIFFAYDVVLYLVMTRAFHWWSPAEALVHPDVLATYAPWLSAIGNSLQAGFWEESLFRAVPIAGAALIGERFGQRKLFIVIAFVVQALVFGAGHAPYPNQPAYARPVELIVPSIGFGLLYLYFGLLPGIILHFTFDVVWFALPIFMMKAPGIWFQQLMIVVLTFVPLWVVFWRRGQTGAWTDLPASSYNRAWQPPPAPAPVVIEEIAPAVRLDSRAARAWLTVGGVSAAAVLATLALSAGSPYPSLPITRAQAERIARQELQRRGATLTPAWRVMPVPDNGSGAPHQFVYETAGEARWRQLLGVYLPGPMWRVRVATFQGDVAARAEEWHVSIDPSGRVRRVEHVLPEASPGASLDQDAARRLAVAAVKDRYGLDEHQIADVSATPARQQARTDWTFTFRDTTIEPLPQGEPWIEVVVTGDTVTSTGRLIHVPEEWARQQRAASTRNLVIQIATAVVTSGLLLTAAISGMVAWSRRRYAPRTFLAVAAVVLLASAIALANSWPNLVASLTTAAPLPLQLAGVLGVGAVGLAILAAVVGLAMGALPPQLAGAARLDTRHAVRLGIAAGLFGAAATAAASAVRTAAWARTPNLEPLATLSPTIAIAIGPLVQLLTQIAVVTFTLLAIDRWTLSWTRRRTAGAVLLVIVGVAAAGAPAGPHLGGWALAGLVTGSALAVLYATLLRFDITMVPIALGTMLAVRVVSRLADRPYPGMVPGLVIAAALVTALAALAFLSLRRTRAAPAAPAV